MLPDTPPQGFTHRCSCGSWTRKVRAMPRKPVDQCCSCFTAGLQAPLQVAVDRMSDAVAAELAEEPERFDEFTGPWPSDTMAVEVEVKP